MPTDFSQDAVNNAIYDGIQKGIDLCIEHKCFGSAIILLLSAIDAMAYLAMPEMQDNVARTDFVVWAEKYVQFQRREQLTGADLYGARCAMLHTYGARSKMNRKGECRVIVWMDAGDPPIKQSDSTPGYVAVSIQALRNAVFEGISRFLIDQNLAWDLGRRFSERSSSPVIRTNQDVDCLFFVVLSYVLRGAIRHHESE